jgi:hypothetical protein
MSTESGIEALAALRSLRDLHRQCATLLRTADEVAAERGWEPWVANQVLIQPSYSLEKPEQWIPDVLFRYYRPAGRRDLALFLALLLLPRDAQHFESFREPLLSAGWVRFSSSVTDAYLKPLWLARAAFWTTDARDGQYVPFVVPPDSIDAPIRRVAALPLWSVTDTDALRRIIDGLADDVAMVEGSATGG